MSQALLVLENFLTLSEAMALAAEAQDWEGLARTGEERSALSGTLPTDLVAQASPMEHDRARTILERCQHLDIQTQSLIGDRQKALRILLREPG